MESSFLEVLTHFLQKWGELSFVSALVVGILVIVLSLVPVPRALVNIAIGAVFGFPAMPVIMVSNAIGAAVAFLLAGYRSPRRRGRADLQALRGRAPWQS